MRGFIFAGTKPRRLKPTLLKSHAQDYAESCFAALHSFVGFGRALEWIDFGHRPYAGERAVGERVLRIDG